MNRVSLSLSALLLVIACSAAPSRADEDVIRFVAEPVPPFTVGDDDKPAAGAMVEVMQSVCAKAKRICTFEIMPFRRSLAIASEGIQFDGIMPSMRIPEREQAFLISDPIVKTAYSFFVSAESTWQFHTQQDLNGMTLIAYGPSATSFAVQEAAQHTNAVMQIELSMPRALQKLAGGRYGASSAVVMNRDVGQFLIKDEKISGVKLAGDLKPIDYCFAMSRKSPHAGEMAALNDALHQLQKAGVVQSILDKYGLEDASK